MATNGAAYKRNRGKREAKFEETFKNGMYFSEGPLDEGYAKVLVNFDINSDKGVLKPRRYLSTKYLLLPNPEYTFLSKFWDDSFGKYNLSNNSWMCGKYIVNCKKVSTNSGVCYFGVVCNSKYVSSMYNQNSFFFKYDLQGSSEHSFSDIDYRYYDIYGIAGGMSINMHTSDFSGVSIHDMDLISELDASVFSVVGTYAFNKYYFMYDNAYIAYMDYSDDLYMLDVNPLTKTPTEAVSYGYNMLLTNPYSFKHAEGAVEITGILPYEGTSSDSALLMTPTVNQKVTMKAFVNAHAGDTEYYFKWDYRTLESDDWIVLRDTKSSYKYKAVTVDSSIVKWQAYYSGAWHDRQLYITKSFPSESILVRLQMFTKVDGEYELETAMVVGFDFSAEQYGSNVNLTMDNFDLYTAKGMFYWNERLGLYGVDDCKETIWLSDYNEPAYFPYPNNIVTFDENVIAVHNYLDGLLVFTTTKIYQVTSSDGTTFSSTLVQSNLSINDWDKHLIQVVRNMVFFKSGNYYYMIVPKSSSTTGELTIAPVSNSIKEFFDNFEVNVTKILSEMYGEINIHDKLVHYYNFLNYNEVWNMYVFKYDSTDLTYSKRYINFALVYNTETRTWCSNVFESESILTPVSYNATDYCEFIGSSLYNTRHEFENYTVTDSSYTLESYGIGSNHFYLKKDGDYVDNISGEFNVSINCLICINNEWYTIDNISPSVQALFELELPITNPSGYSYYKRLYHQVFAFNDDLEFHLTTKLHIISNSQNIVFSMNKDAYNFVFTDGRISTGLSTVDDWMIIKPWQYIDTGYFKDAVHYYKRFRELQFSITNVSHKNLTYNLYFDIDGAERLGFFRYEPYIDTTTSNVWLEPVPIDAIKIIDGTTVFEDGEFVLDNARLPEISLYKSRVPVSGKGMSGRLKLLSKNTNRYELYSINWIYRVMNMR